MTIKKNAMGVGTPAAQAETLVGGVSNTISAAGSTQAGATLLAMSSNNIVTVGASSTGVILPPGVGQGDGLTAGDWVCVANYVSGNAINVYPPLGGKIQSGTLNAAFSVGALKAAKFVCIDGLNFFVILSA